MKKIIIYLLVLSAYVMPLKAADTTQQTMDLKMCIDIALKNNAAVQNSMLQSEKEHLNWQQKEIDLLPTLNINITHGVNQGRSIDPYTNSYLNQQLSYANQDLSGSLLLFNGMGLQKLIRQGSLAFQASKQEEQQTKDNLTLNIILAYLQVLTNEELLGLFSKQQEVTFKQVERLELLNNKGAIVPSAYYDLKGQYANDQLAVVDAKNTLANSKLLLVQLLNIPYTKNIQLAPLTAEQYALADEINPEQVYLTAVENLAIVKAADLNEKSAVMQIKYNRSRYYPSVYLRGGLYSNYSSAAYNAEHQSISYLNQFNNNLSSNLNIGVTIPLLNAFTTKKQTAIAKINRKEMEIAAQNTRTAIQQLTAQACFNMATAKERYAAIQDQTNAFSESFRTTEIRFNAGAINVVEYLISKNNLDKAKINFATARYDFILRKKIVEFYQGKLLP